MSRLAQAVYGLAAGSGAVHGLRWLQRHRVPVLCYHSVVSGTLPPALGRGKLHLPAGEFRAQLDYLLAHYRVISLRQAVASLAGESGPLPPRSVVLTFDDGYANTPLVAAPVLRAHGIRATCFVATDYIDCGDLFWWDECALALAAGAGRVAAARDPALLLGDARLPERRQLLQNLWTAVAEEPPIPAGLREQLRPATWSELQAAADVLDFGGHSAEHRFLDHLPDTELTADLARCREALATRLPECHQPLFAYPAGRYDAATVGAVRAAGFTAAVAAEASPRHQRLASRHVDRWAVPRLGIAAGMRQSAFAAALAGIPSLFSGSANGARS